MVTSLMNAFWQEEDGQDLVEYSLLLAFIALAAVALLQSAKSSINSLWTNISSALANAASASS
ncbi:MAG: Flp family type IVb pilin [Acidobacteriaceae bacterium]|nr:Flp family type IVb pilin [Acidobacteriaceae bacterium]MBV9296604.1 Flp family type IVb pilin [Acidobacteriaceae bacterium]MBV9764440.1 Flp family type IVb pilin [Acidobacteriaceae bacterium]